MGMGAAAVDEQQAGLSGVPPCEVVDGASLHFDLLFAIGCFEGPDEPVRRLRDVLVHVNSL
jgi:hypothetical protein